jgi:hypothetical protein
LCACASTAAVSSTARRSAAYLGSMRSPKPGPGPGGGASFDRAKPRGLVVCSSGNVEWNSGGDWRGRGRESFLCTLHAARGTV